MKLQCKKNTFHVSHFYIDDVLLTTNSCKQVRVIKSRGALGTGLTTAPVLCRAGGKPSTWFPPGTRRAEPAFPIYSQECLQLYAFNFEFPNENQFFNLFEKFSKLSTFFNIMENP